MATLRKGPVVQASGVLASAVLCERPGSADPGRSRDGADGAPIFGLTHRGAALRLNPRWAPGDAVNARSAVVLAAPRSLSEMRRAEMRGCNTGNIADPDGHHTAFGHARTPVPGPGLSTKRGLG